MCFHIIFYFKGNVLHLVIGHSLLTLVSEVINIRLKRLELVHNYSVRISKAWYLETKTFRICSSVLESWYYKVILKFYLMCVCGCAYVYACIHMFVFLYMYLCVCVHMCIMHCPIRSYCEAPIFDVIYLNMNLWRCVLMRFWEWFSYYPVSVCL